MGDRTWLSLRIHREDLAKALAVLNPLGDGLLAPQFEDDDIRTCGEIFDDETQNMDEVCAALDKAGARYYGEHGHGSSYGGRRFCNGPGVAGGPLLSQEWSYDEHADGYVITDRHTASDGWGLDPNLVDACQSFIVAFRHIEACVDASWELVCVQQEEDGVRMWLLYPPGTTAEEIATDSVQALVSDIGDEPADKHREDALKEWGARLAAATDEGA